ncbi:GAF and ANTAR domain-containing protein [Actinoplanes xinjiangensis]|uniref:GAF and ANTAR domain-containing protein n=1 Tax=Actinoplanes xinjiangensis TaxID=512350 RepID=UPI003437D89B
MSREQAIAEAFVELSDTLVADIDVVEFVRLLTRRSVQLLDVQLAGVMVADLHGVLRLTAASSEYRRLLELFENDVAPCVDSFVTGEMVAVPDLDADGGRWPQFTRQARVAGFRTVYALPMRLRGEVIGVLALLRGQAGPLRDDDVRLGQALANVTTVGLLQHRTLAQRRVLGEQLRHVLNSRVLIEQAKGVLAERLGLDIDAALDELSRLSERVGRPLHDIARAVVDGDPATARSDADPRTDLVMLVRGFDLDTLDALHDVVERRLLTAGLAEPVRHRLVRAIHGAAIAAVGHGGSGRLWLWSRADGLWCEVSNGGRGGPVDVTARAVATRGRGSGDGLWVSDQVDDDLVILTDPTDGTRLLRYRLPAPVPPEHR